MSPVEGLRIYAVSVSVLVTIIGAIQWRQWATFMPQNQLAWLSLAMFNLAIGLGTLEALLTGAPGGLRSYLTVIAETWALTAVCYRPSLWVRLWWRNWRRKRRSR